MYVQASWLFIVLPTCILFQVVPIYLSIRERPLQNRRHRMHRNSSKCWPDKHTFGAQVNTVF